MGYNNKEKEEVEEVRLKQSPPECCEEREDVSMVSKAANGDQVDSERGLLPEWLNGCDDFAEVMRENADSILASLDEEDRAKLNRLLPK